MTPDMDRVTEDVASSTVLDLQGAEHPLAELWRERTGVLVFLRHFGCVFCQQQAVEVHRERPQLLSKGAELHLIGNGETAHAQAFARVLGLTCPLWTDPSLVTFRALQMKRGFRVSLGSPSTWLATVRAIRQGLRQGRTQGDAWQLGGVLVVRAGGELVYRHTSAFAGDHPPVGGLLAAIR